MRKSRSPAIQIHGQGHVRRVTDFSHAPKRTWMGVSTSSGAASVLEFGSTVASGNECPRRVSLVAYSKSGLNPGNELKWKSRQSAHTRRSYRTSSVQTSWPNSNPWLMISGVIHLAASLLGTSCAWFPGINMSEWAPNTLVPRDPNPRVARLGSRELQPLGPREVS